MAMNEGGPPACGCAISSHNPECQFYWPLDMEGYGPSKLVAVYDPPSWHAANERLAKALTSS